MMTAVVVIAVIWAVGTFFTFLFAALDYSVDGGGKSARRIFLSPLWFIGAWLWLNRAWNDANPVEDEKEVNGYGYPE